MMSGGNMSVQASNYKENNKPTLGAARISFWVILVGFLGFILWAAYAPLDEGVVSMGSVVIETKRKSVQTLQGGVLNEILVREGQFVREGDTLAVMDGAALRANYSQNRQAYLTLRAMESRLVAEQSGASEIVFHGDLAGKQGDRFVDQLLSNQRSLLAHRRESLRLEIGAVEEAIRGYEESISSLERQIPSRRAQIESLRAQEKGLQELAKEGYVPRNTLLEIQRQVEDRNAQLVDLIGSIARTKQNVVEQRKRIAQRTEDYMKEVGATLNDVRREVEADSEKVLALKRDLDRTLVKAPISGQVIGLSVQTIGAVLPATFKIMDIVPQGERLLIEAKIAPQLIDSVRAGQPVTVRLSAFAHSPQLVLEGRLDSISTDLLQDQQVSDPSLLGGYYLARISITDKGSKALGARRLLPGMQAEVLITTGERSLLTYLMHPMLKRVMGSLKEE